MKKEDIKIGNQYIGTGAIATIDFMKNDLVVWSCFNGLNEATYSTRLEHFLKDFHPYYSDEELDQKIEELRTNLIKNKGE